MITSYESKKVTAKTKAQDIFERGIDNAIGYWKEDAYHTDGMTEKEIEKVDKQLQKIANRLLKVIGYLPKY